MRSILGVLCFILLEQCNGVIYYLNETEYNRMPPIYRADNINECLQKPDDVYCTVHFDLISDERSELLDMIQEYSEKTSTHYNHTKIRYSVCVSEYCQSYIRNKNAVTPEYLERCLNHTIWNDYKLKTKVEKHYCHTSSDDIEVDASDITVAVLLLAILLLNIIGTINDTECVSNGKEEKSVLSCFSIRRNWKSLVKDTNHPDPRLQRFRGINFWRCFILLGVIMVHCVWPFFIALDNSYDLEMNYYKLSQHLILNGSIVLQTYMVISGLLMSYKMELNSEEKRLSWLMVPRGIVLRYFRLTPVYAVTIAVMATWTKFIGPGPFWEVSAGLVRSHCRTSWWQNLLYINNYFYNAQCIVGGWYLGVDMQMFVVGIVTCVALRGGRRRAAVLATLFTAGVLVLAVHIYMRDLHPIMIMEPTETATFFEKDPTTNETYKMGHANVTSYIVGLALGYLVYSLQKLDIDIKKYRSGLAFHNDNVCRVFMVNDHECKIETGTIFENEPSFNEIYKMGHANVTSYIVGLALGYLVYRLQQYKIAIRKYRKYRYIYWSLPFLLLGIVLSGSIFYRDAPRDPTYIRALYGALVKPVFGIITAGLICGTIFKLENVYRGVMEWKVWTVPSRLSYCVYIIHLPCLRIFLSSRTTLLTLSTSNQWLLLVCVTVVSFSAALPLWLLVETPFVKLTKHWSSGRTDRHRDKQAELVDAGREKSEYANINTRL